MSKRTVFVIGAGASAEVGLPTGDELKENIANLMPTFSYDYDEYNYSMRPTSGDYTLIECFNNNQKYYEAAKRIKESLILAASIDQFIHKNRYDNNTSKPNDILIRCAKLAIAKAILKAEKESKLYCEDINKANLSINFDDIKNTWYIPFFQLITGDCTANELEERFKLITLIIFNYDRCIEHFLFYALIEEYDISFDKALELIQKINIYHPYGKVGDILYPHNQFIELILTNIDGENFHVSSLQSIEGTMFGEDEPTPEKLSRIANNIKTFTESTDDETSQAIKKDILLAGRLIFLGFAFHELNMKIINIESYNKPEKSDPLYVRQKKLYDEYSKTQSKLIRIEYYATTYKTSNSYKKIIRNRIKNICGLASNMGNVDFPYIELVDGTCSQFFENFSMSLSF